MRPHLPAQVAGNLAGKDCHNRAGDSKCGPLEEQAAHGIWSNRGQLRDLHGLLVGELLRWAKTRVLKNGHASSETKELPVPVLKGKNVAKI